MKVIKKKVLSFALALVVLLTTVLGDAGLAVRAEGTTEGETTTYTQVTSVSDITAGGDMVLVAKTDNGYFAVGTTIKNKIDPVQVAVSEEGILSGDSVPVWTVAGTDAGISLSNGTNCLAYGTSTNFKKGTDADLWSVSSENAGTFRFASVASNNRGIGYQVSGNRFGAYAVSNATNADYVLDLLVFKAGGSTAGGTGSEGGSGSDTGDSGETGDTEETEVTVTAIADVRAASAGSFTVEGTVIFIDGKNVVLQDATGGINLYCGSAATDLAVGDTVQATGTRGAYNGLEQLSGATYKKIGTAELPVTTKTIAEIQADVTAGTLESTRVYIENAVIGAVNTSGNTTLTQDGATINIYKIPALTDVPEGATVSLYAVVSDYNGYQLRVASASDVTKISDPAAGGEEEEDGKLKSGNYVIWAPAYNKALSSIYSGYYNQGVNVSLDGAALSG